MARLEESTALGEQRMASTASRAADKVDPHVVAESIRTRPTTALPVRASHFALDHVPAQLTALRALTVGRVVAGDVHRELEREMRLL